MAGTSNSTIGSSRGLDLSRTLTFFFEDPNWVPKLFVGSLFAFLTPFLIGSVFMMGYAVLLAKHTMSGKSPVLPEWDDLRGIFIDGLKGLAISLAHKLPVFILTIVLLLALFGSALLQQEGGSIRDQLMYYGLPALFGGWLLVFLLGLAILFYVPAAFVRFIQTDRLGAAFDVMDNVTFIREHSAAYLMGLLAIILAGFIAQFGFLVFCIGVFPAAFWSTCVAGYVVGELARLGGGPNPAGAGFEGKGPQRNEG